MKSILTAVYRRWQPPLREPSSAVDKTTFDSGAAAQDFGGREGSGTTAGFINGVGSLGQLCSPFLVALVVDNYGWDQLFYVFVFFALIGGVLLSTHWNTRPPGNSALRGDPEPAAVT